MSYDKPLSDSLKFNFGHSSAYTRPNFNSVNFDFTPPSSSENEISPFGIFNLNHAGTPTLLWTEFARPYGFDVNRIGSATIRPGKPLPVFSFTQSQPYNFGHSSAYTRPNFNSVNFDFTPPSSSENEISPFGTPTLLWTEFARPYGFDVNRISSATIRPGKPVPVFSFTQSQPYNKPSHESIRFVFGSGGAKGIVLVPAIDPGAFGKVGVKQDQPVAAVGGFNSLSIGVAAVVNKTNYLHPIGFVTYDFGAASLKNKTDQLWPTGISASSYGKPLIFNSHQYLLAQGFASQAFGRQVTYNLRQYLYQQNQYNQSSYGVAYLQGGVKYLEPYSFYSNQHGKTIVINTRAEQYAGPTGIDPLSMPIPNVSPRYIRPIDISPPIFPQPLVQRSPYPLGLDHSSYGDATLWFRVRCLSPAGILGFDSGYAKIFDPTQFIYANPPQTSAVFGDIKTKNKNLVVYAEGMLASAVNEWAVFENTLRLINAKGIDGFIAADTNIANKTPSIIPDGFVSPVGEPSVADRVRRVNVVGIPYLFFGLPTLTTPPSLVPKGGDYLRFGDTFVSLKTRTVFIGGTYSLSVGNATVWPWSRNVALDGIKAPVLTNDSTVTHGLRELLPRGSDSMKFSASHWLSFRIRTIVVESIVDNDPNTSHRVSRNIIIYPAGFDATEWGSRIIPENKTLLPTGIAPSVGTPAIDWFIRSLYPNGFRTSFNAEKNTDIRFGIARAFNKTQYIVQFFDVASGLVPQDFSQWTAIELRNKTISTYGVDAKKIGYALVSNNAAQISPVGAQGYVGSPFISYRVRSVFADAIDSPYMANWNVIYNAAFVVAPISKNMDAFGVHRLFSNLQTLKANGAEMPSYGYHMVDFAVRTLQMESRYGIYPAYINLPDVQLHTRYIAPIGFDSSTLWASNFGMPDLAIHRNIISPKWTDRQYLWWGEAALKNLTPELGVYGNANELFGVTSIRTQWENVFTKGDDSLLHGKVLIEFKTKEIAVAGLNAVPISQLHKVIKLGVPPYSTQYIDLRRFYEVDGVLKEGDGYGVYPPNNQVSNPAFNQSVIYPEGLMTAKFGDARVTANTLRIDAGIYILGVANPSVGLKVRELVVKGIDNYIGEGRIGKPRITPHTIYAPFGDEATSQARLNHPGASSSYVNTGVKFGSARVINKNRILWHYGAHTGNSFGMQSLTLSRQYIQPKGIHSEKSGWHSIPFSLQTVMQLHEDGLDSFQQFGIAMVGEPPYLGSYTIKTSGESYQLFGVVTLENSIRFLYPVGLYSAAMGDRKYSDNPFMWQGLRIGELVLGSYGGGEHSALGLPLISAKVRDIGAEGFDALFSEYDIYNFKTRMRVYRQTIPTEKDYIQAIGISAVEFGNAKITHGQYFIRPDGNSETYRQGIG